MAYNNNILIQKRAAVVMNTWKLTRVHMGAIGFKGCKNSGHIRVLSGVKNYIIKVQKQEIKHNRNVIRCRDGTPKVSKQGSYDMKAKVNIQSPYPNIILHNS